MWDNLQHNNLSDEHSNLTPFCLTFAPQDVRDLPSNRMEFTAYSAHHPIRAHFRISTSMEYAESRQPLQCQHCWHPSARTQVHPRCPLKKILLNNGVKSNSSLLVETSAAHTCSTTPRKKVPAPDDHKLHKRAMNNEDKSVDADDFLDNTHTSSMSSSYLDASAGCSLYIKRRGRLPDLLYLHIAERCIL